MNLTDREPTSWWARPCGGRELLAICLPMVVSTLSFVVMQFFDRLFLTWYSNLDLAAVVPSGALAWTSFSLPLGIAMYVTTFVAQYEGAKRPDHIGEIVWQGIWIGLICFPFFIFAGYYSPWFFEQIGHSSELVWREAKYFNALCYGSAATVIAAALESFFIGRGKTTVVMVVSILASGMNIVLDYVMIFGWSVGDQQWFMEAGIEGAGWATTLATWFKTLVLFWLFATSDTKRFQIWTGCKFSPGPFARLMRFGVPNGFQFLVEGGAITTFILIIARISDTASAAAALAFSVNMIVFVPIFGLSIGVTTIVGQQIGDNNPHLAERVTWTAMWIGIPYTILFGLAYFLVPDWFLVAHEIGNDEFAGVKDLAVFLLMFVAVYCLFDTVQLIFVSCLKGAGDTFFVVMFTIMSSLVFLAVGFLGSVIGSTDQFEINWWWSCLTLWISALSVAYYLRFRNGKWRTMSVIEPQFIPTVVAESGTSNL